jgi:two-component system nitrogen regulation response regulator GlnG
MLAKHFLQRSAKQLGVEPKRISEAALQRLAQFGFPGNVRQLENICHWLTVMAPAQQISVQDLPPEVLGASASTAPVEPAGLVPLQIGTVAEVPVASAAQPQASGAATAAAGYVGPGWESLLEADARKLLQGDCKEVWDVLSKRFESSLITTALGLTHGKRMEAAQRLGIGRNTITRKIQELGLDGPERGAGDEV